jgi:ABC-type transporter Mla subunit MlaD
VSDNQNPLLVNVDRLVGMLSSLDPVECGTQAVSNAKRTVESVVSIVENLASTLENLNKTTVRVNALLDEVEEPLRKLMPQVSQGLQTLSSLGDASAALTELAKGIGPLTQLAENAGFLFGMKPKAQPNTDPDNTDSGSTTT